MQHTRQRLDEIIDWNSNPAALRVSDGRIPHQRHSSYQVLDWGPGSTRVLQAILVLVKITHQDTSTANSRVLPEEPIKV